MRIAIGAIAGIRGGPATYAIELTKALVREFPEDRFTVLTDLPAAFSSFTDALYVPLRSSWAQPVWDHLRVRRILSAGRFDLYHGTKGTLPLLPPVPSVVTIHDLANYVMPETFGLPQRLHLALETPLAVKRARVVLTVSENSARDLRRFFPSAAGRVVVVSNDASPQLAPADPRSVERWKRDRGLSGVLVGYLGTIQPRKNLELLVDAFLLAAGDRDWRLVIAGRLRPGYRPACLDAPDPRVRYLGPIDDDELPLFFGALRCMVSPSMYEGFGLSYLEAMRCGCPVIGLANSSVPEVVGDAGLLVERAEASDVAAAIREVVEDEAVFARCRRKGLDRAALFSWAASARAVHEQYARVIGDEAR